jgi:hypothetical protein
LYRFRPERHPSIPVLTSCNWERKFTLKVEVHGKLHGVRQDAAVFRSRYRSLRFDNPRTRLITIVIRDLSQAARESDHFRQTEIGLQLTTDPAGSGRCGIN